MHDAARMAFCAAAAKLLHEHGALLICDEVQSGLGRTGEFFAYQHEEVNPDIVTVAKALSGGFVPVGAMLAKGRIFEKVYSSMDRVMVHSATFKGGVLAMTAGLAALHVHGRRGAGGERRTDRDRAADGADQRWPNGTTCSPTCAGRGLMIGLEFDKPELAARQDQLEHAAEGPGRAVRADGRGGRCSSGTASSPRCPATTWR